MTNEKRMLNLHQLTEILPILLAAEGKDYVKALIEIADMMLEECADMVDETLTIVEAEGES